MTYKKGPFFLLYYVFFAVQSESEIRFLRSNLYIYVFFSFFMFFFIEEIGKGRGLHKKGVQEHIRYHEYIAST